jgi:hypothetical protein
MQRIIVSEKQFERLSKFIITEQEKVRLGNYEVTLNTKNDTDPNFGTLNFNVGGKSVTIRLYTVRRGPVNIIKLIPKKNGAFIETKLGFTKILEQDIVDKLLSYVRNPVGEIELDSNILTGKLMAKKV